MEWKPHKLDDGKNKQLGNFDKDIELVAKRSKSNALKPNDWWKK